MLLAFLIVSRIVPTVPDLQYKQPQLAVSQRMVALTFGAGNTVYFAASRDAGNIFSAPIKVAESSHLSLGRHRGPRIEITPAAVVISAVIDDGQLVAWRSTDDGKTWSPPVTVNDVRTSAREGLHGMTSGPDGRLFAVWLDDRAVEGGRKLLAGARSMDGGATWSKNVIIYRKPDGPICECCHPSGVFTPDGTLHVMWRNSLNGERNMYIAESSDSGVSFAGVRKLGMGTWHVDACPMDGGGLAVEGGEVVSIWRRANAVFLDRPGQPETELANGRDPALSAGAKGLYAAWSSGWRVMVLLPGSSAPVVLSDEGAYPSLAGAFAAWESKGGIVIKNLESH
jgi:hypothetical protein